MKDNPTCQIHPPNHKEYNTKTIYLGRIKLCRPTAPPQLVREKTIRQRSNLFQPPAQLSQKRTHRDI